MHDKVAITEYFTQALQAYGVDTVFGIVGIPIVELADTMISKGIRFIACRNEQSASYAASSYGYMTGKPGVLLVVGGPGLVHALAGIYNSMSNRWPLVVLAGSSEDQYKGGFQELDQISLLSSYLKFTGRLSKDQENIDLVTYNAISHAIAGTPGVTYIDFPGNLINESINITRRDDISPLTKVKCSPDPEVVTNIAKLLCNSQDKRILLVIGKGAVNSFSEIRNFIEKFNLPFLPTPMAKGVVPDSHPLNVSSARSSALKEAEIVIVLAARLNWMLHFAEAPKWNQNARFIQIDSNPETLGQNNSRGLKYSLYSDIGLAVESLADAISRLDLKWEYSGLSIKLKDTIRHNQEKLHLKEISPSSEGGLLNYNQVYHTLRPLIIDEDTIIVAEGANTMDVARISFPSNYPKHRLDAGTNATMGIGLGYAIAAKLAEPKKDVVVIQGDSAFGFSAMELETAVRYKLGLIVIVMNNSGIYHGVDPHSPDHRKPPSTALSQQCRYDLLGKGLGTHGYFVSNLQDLEGAFKKALISSKNHGETSVINVIIEPGKQTKLSFGWQNKKQRL